MFERVGNFDRELRVGVKKRPAERLCHALVRRAVMYRQNENPFFHRSFGQPACRIPTQPAAHHCIGGPLETGALGGESRSGFLFHNSSPSVKVLTMR